LGYGSKRIALQVNNGLALSTVQKLLCSRSVLGEYQPHKLINGKRVADGDPIVGYFPQLITQSEWAAARAEVTRKDRLAGHRKFCNRNANAANLFGGLLFDATTKPIRTLNFEIKGPKSRTTLVSAYDRITNRKRFRYPYDRFERAFLGWLPTLVWKKIANEGKSEEEIQLQKQLDDKLSELDKVERRIVRFEAAMDSDIEPEALRELAGKLARDRAAVVGLMEQKDMLQTALDAAKGKSEALTHPEQLMTAIANPDNVEMRQRTLVEIRKRIRRILFYFDASSGLDRIQIHFINGSLRVILIKDDEALLVTFSGQLATVSELVDSDTTVVKL
jgi:hypothetical protein